MSTMYNETERMLTLTHLDRFNLNPFAFWEMIENYISKIHPKPVKTTIEFEQGHNVELTIYAVGNVSTKYWGDPRKLDEGFLNLFALSYHKGESPRPVSFQVMQAIEIHLRTPGVMDSQNKNAVRNVWNPLSKDGK